MLHEGFNSTQFQEQVSAAVAQARQLLGTSQNATLFDGSFETSFLVAEQLTQVLYEGLGSLLFVGPRPKVAGKSWSLRWSNVETRSFWETTHEVRSDAVHERTYSERGSKVTDYTIRTEKVYHVRLEDVWSIVAFEGADAQATAVTQFEGRSRHEQVGSAWQQDSAKSFQELFDVNVTSMLLPEGWRIRDKTVIPSRTKTVQDACELAHNVYAFLARVLEVFQKKESFAGNEHTINSLNEWEMFRLSPLVLGDKLIETSVLLAEHERRWKLTQDSIRTVSPVTDLKLVSRLRHAYYLCRMYRECIRYLEKRMYEALVSAVGKHVSEGDLEAYMQWHNSRRARPPVDFAYAVRRADNDPEGIVSLETTSGEPVKVWRPCFFIFSFLFVV